MTSSAETRAQAARPGFTLLELLIVLAILGMVAVLFALRGPAHSATLDFRAAAETLTEGLRATRARAIATGSPAALDIDTARHAWQAPARVSVPIPPRIAIAIETVAGQMRSSSSGRFQFLPDGSSSGGRILLADDARRAEIDIDWLSGQVTLTEGTPMEGAAGEGTPAAP